jgi:hypothetical protein
MRSVIRLFVIAVSASVLVAVSATIASAQTPPPCDPYTSTCVGGVTGTTRPVTTVAPTIAPATAAAPQAKDPRQTLPFTGADITGMVVLATVLLGAGAVLVTVSRRRAAPVIRA